MCGVSCSYGYRDQPGRVFPPGALPRRRLHAVQPWLLAARENRRARFDSMTQAHESPSDQERAQKKEERRGTVPVRMPRDYRAEPERDSAESEREVDQPPTDDDYSDCEKDTRELVQAMGW